MEENRHKVLVYHPSDVIAKLLDTTVTQSPYGDAIEVLIPEGKLSRADKLAWALQCILQEAPSLLVSTATYLDDLSHRTGSMQIVVLDAAKDVQTPRHHTLREKNVEIVHIRMDLRPEEIVASIAHKVLRA